LLTVLSRVTVFIGYVLADILYLFFTAWFLTSVFC
jgi:hypothetical protein